MDALLEVLARRDVVIALALAGAALAMIGSVRTGRTPRRWREALLYCGYAITSASVLLFIVAGFRN